MDLLRDLLGDVFTLDESVIWGSKLLRRPIIDRLLPILHLCRENGNNWTILFRYLNIIVEVPNDKPSNQMCLFS